MPLFDFYGSDIQSEEEKHALQPLSPDVPQAQTVVQEGGLQDAFDDTPIPRVKLQHKYNKPEQQGAINPYGEGGLTGRQLSNLRRSFSEDPLLCIEDNEMRQKIESIAATFGVEDGERIKKAVALAHYYSMGHREKTGYIFDNLDAAIQEFEGKPMSVDQAYESVKQLYEPQQEGIWGNRWVAAATAGGAEVDKTAANAVSFLGRRLTESGQIVAITGAGLYSGLLRLIGADGKAARVWESAKDSLLSRDYGKEWEDAVQKELAKPIETVETWAQQNMKVPENWVTDSESVSDWVENAGLSLLNYAPQLGAQLTLMTATGGVSSLGLVYGINGYYDIKGDLPEISEEKALLYGLGIGLINGALENVSLGIVEGKVAEHFASNGIKKGMTRILEYLGASALMEGAEESLEEFTENVLDIAMGRRGDKTDWTSKDWTDNLFRGMPEAFFLGFTTGFGMAGLNVKPLREKAELNQKVRNYAEKRKSDLDAKETMTKDEELEYNVLSAALDSNDPNRVLHAAKVVSLNAKLRQQQEQNAAQKRYNEAEERFSKAQEELDAISARPTQDAKNRNTAVTKYRAAKAELDAAKADLDAARKDFVKAFPEEETIEERAIREAEEVRIARDLKRRIGWNPQDTIDTVNQIAQQYQSIPIHAVMTFDDLPENAKEEARRRGIKNENVDAVWCDNEVYVVADKLRPGMAGKKILHEVVGHAGLRRVFGDQYNGFLDDVFAQHSAEIEEMGLASLYNTKPDTVEGRRYLADEFLAKLAESDVKPSWWKELLAQIRTYLRNMFPGIHFSDADIEVALVRSARAMRREQELSDVAPESRFALIGSSGAISNLGRDNPNREINLDNAEKATRMRDYGYSDKEIWLATGWTRGADGQWRMEIPDLNVKTDELTQGDNYNALIDYNGPLDGYVDAPEIFEAYPQLKQYNVMFIPLPRGEGGYFDRANNTIAINRTLFVDQNFDVLNDMAADMKEAKTQHEADIIHANIKEELDTFAEGIRNTLIHEVQHAIQQIEGFARGGNLEDAKNLPDDLDPMFVRANTQLSELEQRYNDAFDKLIQAEAYLDWSDEMSLALSRYVGSNPKSSDLEIIRNGAAGNPHLDSFIEALEHFKRVDFEKNVANLDVVSSKGPFGRYRRFAGEVEARNAEQRAAMSDERRRETMPSETEDVPRENQIVRFSVDQIESPEFKNWFKDSKVVDKDGKPLVVYHDTNAKIYINKETGENWDELDWKAKDEWENRDDWDQHWIEQDFNTFSRVRARRSVEYPGFFFSPTPDPNHEYGTRRIAAFLSLQNPAINPKIEDAGVYDDSGEKAMLKLIEQGYDGIIRKDDDGNMEEYIAFYPEQIKSVDNVGTFDPNNPDIRYSVSPVWTGSAADFEQPSLHYVGTGEGNQVYGWGLYGSSSRGVGEDYAKKDVIRKTRRTLKFRGKDVTLKEADSFGFSEKAYPGDIASQSAFEQIIFLLSKMRPAWTFNAAVVYTKEKGDDSVFLSDLDVPGLNKEKWDKIVDDVAKEIELVSESMRRNLYKQTFWPDKNENLIDWFERVSPEQLQLIAEEAVKEGIKEYRLAYIAEDGKSVFPNVSGSGQFVYQQIVNALGSPKEASEFLYRAGIDGITYIGAASGARNYVAFSDQDIRVDEHIRFSLENYSEEDKQQLVTLLKPKWIEEAFVEPSEVKAFLESVGETDVDENDAWALYHMAGSEIRAEKKKADDKKRDNWIYENDLLYHDAVDYGGLDFKIIPSLRFLDNDEWPGTFIADSWRKRGKKRPQGKNESGLRYHEYLRRREAELTSEHQTGITSDDLAKYIARIRGGDELDIEEQIIEHFRYLNRPKLWDQYYSYKKEQNYRNKIEQNAAEEEFAEFKREQIKKTVEEIIANKGQITAEWAIANPDVFKELYRQLMNEEPPKSRKPSKENLEAINARLANEDVNAAAYKAARKAAWAEFQKKLTALRQEMNDKNANAVKLQREAAAFAEENLPPELRGMFTRGIIKLLDYGTSPSKNFPEGRRMHEFYQLQDEILKASQTKRTEDSIGHIREMLDAVKMKRNWKGIPVSVIPSEQARVERIRKIIDMSAASVANAIEYNNSRILELEAGVDGSFENGEAVDISAEKDKLVEDNALLELFGNLEYRKPDSVLKAEDFLQDLIKGGKAKFKSLLAQQAGRVMVMRQQAVSEITGGKNVTTTGGAVESKDAMNHTQYILKNMHLGSLLRLVAAKAGIDFDSTVAGKLWISTEKSTQKEMTAHRHLQEDFDAELNNILGTSGQGKIAQMRMKGRYLKGLSKVEQKTGVFKTQFSRQKVIDPLDAPIVQVGRSSSKIHLIPVEDYTRRVQNEDGTFEEIKCPGVRSILRAIDNGGAYEIGDGVNLDETGVWMLRKQLEDYDAGIDRRLDFFVDEIDKESAKKLEADSEKDKLAVIFRGKNVESKKVEVPLSQGTALQILLTWEQEDYRANMKWNGWSEDSIEQIKKFLKPETLRLGYWMRDYFAKQRGELDEAVVKRYGAHLPENQNYWPGRFSGSRTSIGTGGMRGAGTMNINPSFLIARKFHLNPLDMDVDAFSVFFDGQIKQNHFLAWTDTIRDMREVFGDTSVQDAINENFGKDVTKNLVERIVTIAQGGRENNGFISSLFSRLNRYWVPAKIAINPSSYIKQGLGVLAYMNNMPVDEYVKYMSRANTSNADYKAFVQMALNSDYLKNRMAGGLDKDLIYLMQNTRDTAPYSPLAESLVNFATYMTKRADRWSALHGGFAVYQYNLDQARKSGLSEKDAQERARRAWMRATDETQQSGYLKDLNYFQQNQGIVRFYTAFLSNPIQVMNLQLQTLNDIKYNSDNEAAKKKLAKQIFVNHVVVMTLMQFTTDMVRAGFNPGDWWEDAEFEDYFTAWLFGPFEGLFMIGKEGESAVNWIANKLFGRKSNTAQPTSAVQVVDEGKRNFDRVWNDLKDGEISQKDIADGLAFAGDLGMLYGATPAPGAAGAGSVGAVTNAAGSLYKKILKAYEDDEDGKKTTSKRRRGGGSKRR